MTDNDIKKALECCSEPAGKCCCEVCPLHHREDSCTTALIKMSVELVNRQQAEIEKLEFSNEHWNDWEVKCRAINEFAERLKECRVIQTANMSSYIDNLVKEMTEVQENRTV